MGKPFSFGGAGPFQQLHLRELQERVSIGMDWFVIDHGLSNLIDTANMYSTGLAEEIVGEKRLLGAAKIFLCVRLKLV